GGVGLGREVFGEEQDPHLCAVSPRVAATWNAAASASAAIHQLCHTPKLIQPTVAADASSATPVAALRGSGIRRTAAVANSATAAPSKAPIAPSSTHHCSGALCGCRGKAGSPPITGTSPPGSQRDALKPQPNSGFSAMRSAVNCQISSRCSPDRTGFFPGVAPSMLNGHCC